jgi:LysR family transcriptional regulator, nitrogen assimilation regulatory protein
MDLRQLQYFVRVAELGNFSRAAASLATGQPALSRSIRGLETDTKCDLFHRNGRGVTLTDAGARLLVHAKGILHQLDGARNALRGTDLDTVGKVVIGLPPSVGRMATVPLVGAFRERFPNAQLAVIEGFTAQLQQQLLAGHIDLGVFHNPSPSPLLEIEPLVTESLCLVSPARSVRGRPKPLAFAQLRQFGLIFPSGPHPIRSLVETEAARRGVTLNIVLEIDAVGSILELVERGYGHAVVPYNVVRAGLVRNGALTARAITRPSLASMLGLVLPARRPLTVLGQRTAELLRAVLREAFAGAPGMRPARTKG